MHASSLINMRNFIDSYLLDKKYLDVLDVGSRDVCGTYKPLFKDHQYVGFDIVSGKNVDITKWEDVESNFYDVVVSGQAFEHIQYDLEVMKEIYRVMKPGAYCCIIAPSKGPKHCLPDYRRYSPDDFAILAELSNLKVIEVWIDYESKSKWDDCILIATKI